MNANTPTYQPAVVSWNTTQACNLSCSHCYLTAGTPAAGELSTTEGFALLAQLKELGTELLILTGGEPLARRDLLALARYATEGGMIVVLGTNGTLLDERIARKLKASGIRGVGISLDSLDPKKHDAFRGLKGAWGKTVRAMEICVDQGLDLAVQTSILPMNYEEILGLIEFAYQKGARAFNAYFLICTGRGERLSDITPQQYETLLWVLIDAQAKYPGMRVRAKCAPHIKRLIYQREARHPRDARTAVDSFDLLASAGCPAGTSYLRIDPQGNITPCPYLPMTLGNVRTAALSAMWEHSEILQRLRDRELRGRCSACEFRAFCVGCRARAFALTGDLMGEDPWCTYQPSGEACLVDASKISWRSEALARLEKIPRFVRGRVKQGAEAYARARGLGEVTPELFSELRTLFVDKTTRGR
jgi:radical SAM protein with 4Fe4S-binding SPASM domain